MTILPVCCTMNSRPELSLASTTPSGYDTPLTSGSRVMLGGGAVGLGACSRIVSLIGADTLPAASLYQAYTVLVPILLLNVKGTVALNAGVDGTTTQLAADGAGVDRKSTRLNSSH